MIKKKRKTKTITLRLDPVMLYMVEVASRKERRTSTSFIECSIEMLLQNTIAKIEDNGKSITFDEAYEQLWSPLEDERIVKLALFDPRLLTYEEDRIWRVVKNCGRFWKTIGESAIDRVNWKVLREKWDMVLAISRDEEPLNKLIEEF